MDSRCIKIAALGRPLYPGMLYDCRSDSFIPGVTLWNKNALLENLDVHKEPKTHLKFAASDSHSAKANLLDVNASLKASFLSGLVEVGGSAKYLQDTKSSEHQSRVTMQYSQTTKFEQLTMNELGNITYPQVFEQKTATHVITAVLYGVHVFMVFDYIKAENENKQEIQGNLHAVVKKIPNISINGQASLNLNGDEQKMAENISVTFYGDIELEETPTTYKEVLEVYKKVPALMKQQQDNGVPLTVWLYPLNLLDDKAAKLEREINLSLVYQIESLLEELSEIERKCNDLINRPITDDFPDVKNRLLKFQALHRNYTSSFQKSLCRVLPAIRCEKEETADKALWDILNTHYTSPFNAINMNNWLDDITTELQILSSCTNGLKDVRIVKSSGSLVSLFLDVDMVVCLSFTSMKYDDTYLAALQDLENSEVFTKLGQKSERDIILQAAQPWFNSDISARMKQNLSLFTSFSKANKNEKGVKFIIASISDPCNPGISIRLYQNGLLTDPKFQPVSKPPKPVVKTSIGKVTLNLSKSPTGETVHFRVEYRMTPSNDSATDAEEWTVIDTSNTENTFSLTGLQPKEQYWVRYRAVSNVGVSEASDSVPFTINGKLTVTLDQWNLSGPIVINKLRTKIMNSPSDVRHPVCNPNKPYLGSIPGGLRPGVALFFQGVVPSDCKRFAINLQTGPKYLHDVAFHFNPRMSSVALDSCRKGKWENFVEKPGGPFVKGGPFDIIMVINPECFEVIVDGVEYCTFEHRRPVHNVNAICIDGQVFMNTIAITEVDDVNLKVRVTNPANF
ncbi:verrucotoxin subunit beta-like [Hemibagrus wyckioides]|uniref:verrucotoxin subunit beta-like n=1 Tax=Hemibagrus wyckioides TaxID=337641 RepID=UPI00266C9EB9|nr:verrucotoxin subunit beta-like [Hemibagrus wyckioides]